MCQRAIGYIPDPDSQVWLSSAYLVRIQRFFQREKFSARLALMDKTLKFRPRIGLMALTMLVGTAGIAPPLAADSVDLTTGGAIDGKTTRGEGHVIVEVEPGLLIALPDRADGAAGVVTSVIESEKLGQYRKNAEKAGNDAELNYKLAIWCRSPGNLPGHTKMYRDLHLWRAIAADPDHERARGALSFTRDSGRWIRQADLMEERGMVRRRGSWVMPELAAMNDANEEAEIKAKQWGRDLPRHIKVIQRATAKAEEAWAFLRGIDDSLATNAIATQLKRSRSDGKTPRNLRRLWVQKLAQFKTSGATAALVAAGLDDPDDIIREAALDALASYPFGASSAVATYLPMLKSNDNRMVNSAARALSKFPDPELAETYTEALVTTHKTVIPPGPGMSLGFGGNGSGNSGGMGGMSTGGKAKMIERPMQNPAVLSLIRIIEPDANYSFNQQRWREHFAAKKNRYHGNLRRDR